MDDVSEYLLERVFILAPKKQISMNFAVRLGVKRATCAKPSLGTEKLGPAKYREMLGPR